ncbi:SDR family oxidoreductase [Corynebacterium aquilae]|uniref:NAD(P)-binding domain-containing protein n=1 Tax=Corynebacterium aquilae DSM 44791 TaxID=1431546 RepID=A0A1L7CFV7_9CORY|nr:SDR family oxidoreductase [Corynebacterium aquilae]APT84729.1 hypothetical protein CAQU_06215 [Corynebacterium aquilae DSM 44791]
MSNDRKKILVTGATGYVGGRLVPSLLDAGHDVSVLVRTPSRLAEVPWAGNVTIIEGDLTKPESLRDAVTDIDVIYYLVHSMGDSKEFARTELECAHAMVNAAENAGCERIIYLSGLTDPHQARSNHMDSRHAVGRVFLDSTLNAVVFQAGIVVGSGSTSFEMIRHLTERLPIMITPKFVRNQVQPIGIDDVLHYLTRAATADFPGSRTWDIGGPQAYSYGEMMNRYAKVAGLKKRPMIPVPVFSPWLASHWVGVITPVPSGIAKPLIHSLAVNAVVTERDIDAYIPPPPGGLTPYEETIRRSLADVRADNIVTRWTDDRTFEAEPLPSDPEWAGRKVFVDERSKATSASQEDLFAVIESIGGEHGWYSTPLLWRIRGWLDRAMRGPGLARGRRSRDHVRLGDAVDWWTVEAIERPRLLRLRADMKVSGDAWLELIADKDEDTGAVTYRQRAIFFPRGVAGLAYWYSILPAHGLVFPTMASNIVAAAEQHHPKDK